MIRLGALVVALCIAQSAAATTARVKQTPYRPGTESLRMKQPAPEPTGVDGQFELTNESEIILNGKPSTYREIPADAVVVKVEISEDRKTILRIEFTTETNKK
jgi:hypothetical protein